MAGQNEAGRNGGTDCRNESHAESIELSGYGIFSSLVTRFRVFHTFHNMNHVYCWSLLAVHWQHFNWHKAQ
jgi:hypothetical protein